MPAAATDDWQIVQDTAVALGSISAAARKCGVSIAAACQRAKREAWPVGRRPAKAIAEAKAAHSKALAIANPSAVINVTSTAAIVSNVIAENRNKSVIAIGGAIRKRAEHVEKQPATKIDAQELSHLASAHSKMNPVTETGRINVNIYGDGRSAGDVVEVESEIMP